MRGAGAAAEPDGGRGRVIRGVVVLVVLVTSGRGGALGGHDLREPRGGGARRDVLRAADVGDAPRSGTSRGAGQGGGGGGGGGAVVGRGDAAGGRGARAAPAALPPVDGAPRPETVHGGFAG